MKKFNPFAFISSLSSGISDAINVGSPPNWNSKNQLLIMNTNFTSKLWMLAIMLICGSNTLIGQSYVANVDPNPSVGNGILLFDGATVENFDDQVRDLTITQTGSTTIDVSFEWIPMTTETCSELNGVNVKLFYYDGIGWAELDNLDYQGTAGTNDVLPLLDNWQIYSNTFNLTLGAANVGANYFRASILDKCGGVNDQIVGFYACDGSEGGCLNSNFSHFDNADVSFNVEACEITSVTASNVMCDDAGTPCDDTDDFLTFELTVEGNGTAFNFTDQFSTGYTAVPGTLTYGVTHMTFVGPAGSALSGLSLTVTDDNDSDCTMTGTIAAGTCSEDTEAPIVDCPTAATGEGCDTDDVEAISDLVYSETSVGVSLSDFEDLVGASAIDNCGVIDNITYIDVTLSGPCPTVIERSFTITDDSGNSETCTQTITYDDTTDPTLDCYFNNPDAIMTGGHTTAADPLVIGTSQHWSILEGADGITANNDPSTALDNCDGEITFVTPNVDDNCMDGQTIEISVTQNVSGTIWGVNNDIPLDSESIDIDEQESVQRTEFLPKGLNYIQFKAVDACGNKSDFGCSFYVLVVDDIAPVAPAPPADAMAQCFDDPAVTDPPVLLFSDNCDGDDLEVEATSVTTPGSCPNNFVIEHCWSYSQLCDPDAAGPETTITVEVCQTVTVNDDTVPEIECPGDVEISCEDSSDPADTGMATATDNCTDSDDTDGTDYPVVSFEDVSTQGDDPTMCDFYAYTITRTWTAEDECGNTATCDQVITVVDDTAPVIVCPDEATLECDEDTDPYASSCEVTDGPLSGPGDFSADATYIDFEDFNAGGTNTAITGLEYVTLGVGISASQDLAISENVAPCGTITQSGVNALTNFDVNCADPYGSIQFNFSNIINKVGFSLVTNNDDDVDIIVECVLNGTTVDNQIVNTSTTYVFYGLASSSGFDQIILTPVGPENNAIILDDLYFESCVQGPGVAMASDNCSEVVITYSDSVEDGDCPQEMTITRTWTATDVCGNASSCDQIINIVDTQAPEIITEASDETIECDVSTNDALFQAWLDSNGGATAEDNCGAVSWMNSCDGDLSEFTLAGTYNGHVYYISNNAVDANTAFALASASGGYMTSINDAAENSFVSGLDGGLLWIGFTDMTTEGTFEWINGDAVTYTNWDIGEPNDIGGEDWVVTNWNGSGLWNDLPEFNSFARVIIEFDSETPCFEEACGATGSAVVTFTASDECGNMSVTSATFTIEDNTSPMGTDPVDDEDHDLCKDEVLDAFPIEDDEATVLAAYSDACGDIELVFNSEECTGDDCDWTLTRTWYVVDECGNGAEDDDDPVLATYSHSGSDQTVPTFDTTPVDQEVFATEDDCSQLVHIIMPDVSDNCDDEISIFGDLVITTDANVNFSLITFGVPFGTTTAVWYVTGEFTLGMTTVTMTLTDACGNETVDTHIITVKDNTPPSLKTACPSSVSIGTDEDVCEAAYSFTHPQYEDNCQCTSSVIKFCDEDGNPVDGLPDIEFDGNSGNFADITLTYPKGVTTVKIISTDESGNVNDDCSFTVEVIDDQDPIFTYSNDQDLLTSGGADCPADATTDLIIGDFTFDTDFTVAGITIAGPASTDFMDNCPEMFLEVVSITYSEEVDPSSDPVTFCSQTVTIEWLAIDCGGNEVGATQVITITDDVAPIVPAAPADAPYSCVEDVPPPGDLTAVDACQGPITVTGVDSDNGGEGCADDPLVITRTWTFDDGCGNVSSVSQTITVIDDIAPVWDFACQLDVTYTTENGDQCPADADISLSIGDVISTTDTWTIGNVTIPSLSGCVSDNCTAEADLDIVVSDLEDDMGVCVRNIRIVFVAVDECGNVSEEFECNYTFIDDTAPIAPAAPADEAYQCVEDVPAPGDLTATDNCQPDITVTGVDTDNGGDGCADDPLVITRTWTFDDGCGNVSSVSQTITVIDDISPVWDYTTQVVAEFFTEDGDQCPADANISLSVGDVIGAFDTWLIGNVEIDDLDVAISDNCSVDNDIVITVTAITDNMDGCDRLITISFSAADECGNVSAAPDFKCSYRFVDNTNPTIDLAAMDAVVECDGAGNEAELTAWLDSNGGAEASDNCQELSWTNDFEALSDDCGETGAATVTFTAHDGCGNSATTTATFTIVDTQDPEFITTPEDQELFTVSTDCNQEVFILVPLFSDACCIDEFSISIVSDDPNINFGPILVAADGSHYWSGDFGAGETEVTITIEDCCGNTATDTHIVNVIDNIPPTVKYCPEDQQTTTDEDLCETEVSWTNPEFYDNCDCATTQVCFSSDDAAFLPEMITYQGTLGNNQMESAIFAKGTTTVCFKGIDVSGNINDECCFDVVVLDDQFPTASDAAPSSYTCVDAVPAPDGEVIIDELDNCPDLVVAFNADDSTIEGSGCAGDPMTMTRVYDVIDCDENTIQVTHVITVEDDVAPTATNPELISVECIEEVPVPDVEVVTDEEDNCTAEIIVAWVSDSDPVEGLGCADGPQFTITREYSITDCGGEGNSISVFQTIVVSDVTAPEALCVETLTVSLDENGEAVITADMINNESSDNCGEISIEIDIEAFTCEELGDNIVTLTVEDENCNVSTCTTVVTVVDEEAPVAECPVDEIVVELDENGEGILAADSVGDGSSTDNCDEVTETNPEQLYTCADIDGDNTVDLTATDASGNSDVATCTVTVVDLLGPVATECQTNIVLPAVTGECSQQVDWDHPTFVDNCDGPIAYDETTLSVTSSDPNVNINYEVEGCEAIFPVGITTITMSVVDSYGNVGSCIFTVEILEPVPAVASFDKEVDGLTVTLTNTSSDAVSYLWDFGDGNTSTDENPVHTYDDGGMYDICLSAFGACGSESEMCMMVDVWNEGLVELTPSFLIDGSTFSQGQGRDAVYVIDNIEAGPTTGPVQILITKTSALLMSMDANAVSANVFGGIPVNNSDWNIVDLGGFFLCTMKSGMIIPSGGYSILCVNLVATGLPSSTSQTTGQLLDNTGGDISKDNNFAQGSFIIN